MILADKIIKERKKLGLSQEELAEKMNISRQSVSKWESNQSLPEIDKILLMSSIFGVTTDYLLKDDAEPDEAHVLSTSEDVKAEAEEENANENNSVMVFTKGSKTLTISSDNSKENQPQNIKIVTMEQAEDFLSSRNKASKNIAFGTFFCILSIIPLLLLAEASEAGLVPFSEDTAGAFGLVLMFLILIPAVVLFVYTGSKNSPYEFLEKEPFELEKGVGELVTEHKKAFDSKYTILNILGTVLCMLSPIPLFISAVSENEFIQVVCLCITLFIAGIGAVFFVMGGVRNEAVQRLLKEGEYSEAAKSSKGIKGAVGAIYWLVITAIYILMQTLLIDQGADWKNSHTWIIWPVAGVLFPVVILICGIIEKNGKKNKITADDKQQ
ncbi:MAG: helix-turn-helix transcriptional regulator [Ruminococcaceae bacterium]|nr:helix-turn-helix transcriptional regulator [Oscillospiraceae bacterium]